MSESFKAGDVVQLKSGGVPMTVEEVEGENISCVWFEGKKSHRQTFVSATLKKFRPASPSVTVI
ncbi:DUF2158 domain-containing protein [Salinisphaera sp. T5B8]|uniref:YodC family protein n=1 Tax=Salinisphaera sp. T5B8 TaxID=1304154 RepID=UPI003340C2E4